MRARENYVTQEMLDLGMHELVKHLNQSDTTEFKSTLSELVDGYKPKKAASNV